LESLSNGTCFTKHQRSDRRGPSSQGQHLYSTASCNFKITYGKLRAIIDYMEEENMLMLVRVAPELLTNRASEQPDPKLAFPIQPGSQ